MSFRILTVCTGNICRSPLAAQLLASKLSDEVFDVNSAGVAALDGETMPDPAQDIAARFGLRSFLNHRGRQLTVEDIVQADLILAMDREHRRSVVELHPAAVRYTYTLTEFSHIAAAIAESQLAGPLRIAESPEQGALDVVSRMRGTVPPLYPQEAFDIEDPYRRSYDVYERSSEDILGAVDAIVAYFEFVADVF